jgi:hypothetical protein
MTKHNPAPPSSLSNTIATYLPFSLYLPPQQHTANMPPSPPRNRSRSRSPPRKPKSSSGFRWKDKGSRANDTFTRDFDDRNRDDAAPPRRSSPPRDRDRRDRSPRRDGGRDSYRARSPRRDDRDRYRDRDGGGGSERRRSPRRDGGRDDRKEKKKEDKPKDKEKEKKPKTVAAPSRAEPMIIVNVNDRLGTKAAIPCLGSDPVSKYFCLSLMLDLGSY